MALKSLALFFLNRVSLIRLRRQGSKVKVGHNSSIYLWRISPNLGSRLTLGDNSHLATHIVFEREQAAVSIGSRTFIAGKGIFSVASSVTIGSDVMISWGCTITDHDSHSLRFCERSMDVVDFIQSRKEWNNVPISPVHINDKAWIGFNCSILKGVTVGEGAVVAANSNVTRNVPPWTLVGGNPARVIRELSPE